ncbi:MAG: putative peptidoglycan binding domain-containing protein [Gaiellaceae bacterium]
MAERLAKLGYAGELGQALSDWAGTENYEMRVDGAERVDPVVLDALRRTS